MYGGLGVTREQYETLLTAVNNIVTVSLAPILPVTTLHGQVPNYTSGVSANFSAWQEIVSAAAVVKNIPPNGLVITGDGVNNHASLTAIIVTEIGIGGVGSEVAIATLRNVGQSLGKFQIAITVPRAIPSGSRIAIRSHSDLAVTGAALRLAYNIGQVA